MAGLLAVLYSGACYMALLFTVLELFAFLSWETILRQRPAVPAAPAPPATGEDGELLVDWEKEPLIRDTLLLFVFVLQHSIMASGAFKR